MKLTTDPDQAERSLWGAWAYRLRSAILSLFGAHLTDGSSEGAVIELAQSMAEIQSTSDLAGRYRVAESASALDAGAELAPPNLPPTPPPPPAGARPVRIEWGDVTFDDALDQFRARHPQIAQSAEQIQLVYERNGFALAKSADLRVTQRIKAEIDRGIAQGLPQREVVARISRVGVEQGFGDWSDHYSRTVFRNANTSANSAGIFQQMADPVTQAVIPALEFDSAQDTRRTEICTAFHGTVAPAPHLIWMRRTPTCHHGCRSSLRLRDRFSLAREGRMRDGEVIPYIPNQHVMPAPGFGRRTDIDIYGPAA